jgi:hypothetical protein
MFEFLRLLLICMFFASIPACAVGIAKGWEMHQIGTCMLILTPLIYLAFVAFVAYDLSSNSSDPSEY